MISYDPLWQTMKDRGITTYTLIYKMVCECICLPCYLVQFADKVKIFLSFYKKILSVKIKDSTNMQLMDPPISAWELRKNELSTLAEP